MRDKKILWFLSCFLVTLFTVLVYAVTQQTLRANANDPQTQITKDVIAYLNAGNDPLALSYESKVDIAKSYAPFIMIFDKNGKLIATSAVLNNKAPELPKGVLDVANKRGENRLTWQPAPGVREATIVTKYNDGYVVVARSLGETEARIKMIFVYCSLAWFLGVLVLTGTYFIVKSKK